MRARCLLRHRRASRRVLPFALFAFEERTRWRVDTSLGDSDLVECAVELAVAATVESVTAVFAAAGLQGGDAGVACELGVAGEAVDRLVWAVTGSNRRPPRCKRGALPTELTARDSRH